MIGTYTGDSITWLQWAGEDAYGDPLDRTSTALSARVVWQVRRVIDFRGQEVLSSGHIKMASKPDPRDRFTIDSTEHVIVAIVEKKSFSRVSHYEVYIQ